MIATNLYRLVSKLESVLVKFSTLYLVVRVYCIGKSGNGLCLVIRSSALAGMANRTVGITYVHIRIPTYVCMNI